MPFARKRLGCRQHRQRLLRDFDDLRFGVLDRPGKSAKASAEKLEDKIENRDEDRHEQRQLGIDPEHQHHRPDRHHHARRQNDQSLGEKIAQAAYFVGHEGECVAFAPAFVKAERKMLDMLEHLLPQVREQARTDARRQKSDAEIEYGRAGEAQKEDCDDEVAMHCDSPDQTAQKLACKPRHGERQSGARDCQNDKDRKRPPERPGQVQQVANPDRFPPGQRLLVGF